MKITLFIIAWLAIGLLDAGWLEAANNKQYPDLTCTSDKIFDSRSNFALSFFVMLTGPIGFIGTFVFTGFGEDGWYFWPTAPASLCNNWPNGGN